ncbi:hypothetical protein [Microcoleus sp. F4-D5]|uniref:hypothetical protein n=1 Tax=Microcoleus sp. F4-D5 TaxID=2818760 RepID=UPI002FCFE86D
MSLKCLLNFACLRRQTLFVRDRFQPPGAIYANTAATAFGNATDSIVNVSFVSN